MPPANSKVMAKAKSEPPAATEPNPPMNRAVKSGAVNVRNISARDFQEGDTLIKPGEVGEVPERIADVYAYRFERV